MPIDEILRQQFAQREEREKKDILLKEKKKTLRLQKEQTLRELQKLQKKIEQEEAELEEEE